MVRAVGTDDEVAFATAGAPSSTAVAAAAALDPSPDAGAAAAADIHPLILRLLLQPIAACHAGAENEDMKPLELRGTRFFWVGEGACQRFNIIPLPCCAIMTWGAGGTLGLVDTAGDEGCRAHAMTSQLTGAFQRMSGTWRPGLPAVTAVADRALPVMAGGPTGLCPITCPRPRPRAPARTPLH